MHDQNTMPRRIVGAIISAGRIFKAGDEAAFAARMQGRDLTALVARGELLGDWTDMSLGDPAVPTARKGGRSRKRATPVAPASAAPVASHDGDLTAPPAVVTAGAPDADPAPSVDGVTTSPTDKEASE